MLAVENGEVNVAASCNSSRHGHSATISSTHSSQAFGSILSHSSAATGSSISQRQSKKRGSLNILISSWIHSHSSSRRLLRQLKDTHASASDMLQDDERPTRKAFSENRASKLPSRSRSRTGRDSPPPVDPNEPVPNLPPSQNGRARVDTMGQCSPSKPSTRIQSRPLSSTTTATNTTVTPGTPRPKKQPPSSISVTKSPSMSETPRASSATRKKLHNLFGISLSSPKKSTFSSSNHARPSLDHAPLRDGNNIEDTDATPKPRRTHSPLPVSRSESRSPTTRQHINHNHSTSSSAGTSSGSSRLQRLLAGQKAPLHPSTDVVSAPIIRRPSNSSHRRANSASNSTSNHSSSAHDDSTQSRHKNTNPMGPSPVPQSLKNRLQVEKSSSLGHSFQDNSNEFGYGGGGVDGLGNLNGHMRMTKIGHSHGHSHRATKHGSFDFERPGWATAATMQRSASGGTTGSNGTTGTSLNGWPRNDGVNGGIRESTMGPGLAGVGTLQRDVSIKRGKEREDMVNRLREEELKRRAQGAKERVTGKESSPRNGQHTPRTRSPEDNRGLATAKTSSWGKKQGAKAKITSTLGISHGPFAFEPAVSSPTWSTGSTGNGHSNSKDTHVSWAGEKGRDKARLKGELERDKDKWQDREKERRSNSANRGDRAPVPVPVTSASMGHRSGAKGRSLDLGLGLAWASSSVREDALLPASGYFGRSASGSSSFGSRSVGRSASGSANGHGAIEEERSVVGNQIASVFKNALDDAGYKAFKRYVDQFDAHEIPFDGPTGIVTRVERLLKSAPGISEDRKKQVLDNFVRVVLQHV